MTSKQTQALTAPSWSLEGGSGTEGQFSPLPQSLQRDWAPEPAPWLAAPQWQHGQWPAQRSYWSMWGVLVVTMSPSQYSSVAVAEHRVEAQLAPGLVPEAHSEIGAEEPVPTQSLFL